MTDYLCMTPQELEEWRTAAANVRSRASSPCVDCPMDFRLLATARSLCLRPARVVYVRRASGPLPIYSDNERRERHRIQSREHMRRKRAGQVAERVAA